MVWYSCLFKNFPQFVVILYTYLFLASTTIVFLEFRDPIHKESGREMSHLGIKSLCLVLV